MPSERTGVSLAGQSPVLIHARNGHAGWVWQLWTSYNDAFDCGTYLVLHSDGEIWRHSISGGRLTHGVCIKPKNLGITQKRPK